MQLNSIFTKAQMNVLKPAMVTAWDTVGAEVEGFCNGDNRTAIDFLLEGDRLKIYGKSEEANDLIKDTIAVVPYVKVLKTLDKNVALLA